MGERFGDWDGEIGERHGEKAFHTHGLKGATCRKNDMTEREREREREGERKIQGEKAIIFK